MFDYTNRQTNLVFLLKKNKFHIFYVNLVKNNIAVVGRGFPLWSWSASATVRRVWDFHFSNWRVQVESGRLTSKVVTVRLDRNFDKKNESYTVLALNYWIPKNVSFLIKRIGKWAIFRLKKKHFYSNTLQFLTIWHTLCQFDIIVFFMGQNNWKKGA